MICYSSTAIREDREREQKKKSSYDWNNFCARLSNDWHIFCTLAYLMAKVWTTLSMISIEGRAKKSSSFKCLSVRVRKWESGLDDPCTGKKRAEPSNDSCAPKERKKGSKRERDNERQQPKRRHFYIHAELVELLISSELSTSNVRVINHVLFFNAEQKFHFGRPFHEKTRVAQEKTGISK